MKLGIVPRALECCISGNYLYYPFIGTFGCYSTECCTRASSASDFPLCMAFSSAVLSSVVTRHLTLDQFQLHRSLNPSCGTGVPHLCVTASKVNENIPESPLRMIVFYWMMLGILKYISSYMLFCWRFFKGEDKLLNLLLHFDKK